jgi:DNA-directed RNA polymerase specialized sigma24 family protein
VPEPLAQPFLTTRWTQVLAARGDSASAQTALSELCDAYYAPVVAFLTHTGCGEADPREVAHEFFARLLAEHGLAGVDRTRGRFRSYLLGAVKHHLANRRQAALREKRGGGVEHQPLEAGWDTTRECQIPAADPRWDAVFDHEWALAVVERALTTLEREADAAGLGRQFKELKAWLSFDAAPGSQAEAAARLGINEGAVKVAIHRQRKRFRELVRAEIAQTLPAGDDPEAELRHLIESLQPS